LFRKQRKLNKGDPFLERGPRLSCKWGHLPPAPSPPVSYATASGSGYLRYATKTQTTGFERWSCLTNPVFHLSVYQEKMKESRKALFSKATNKVKLPDFSAHNIRFTLNAKQGICESMPIFALQ